MNKVKYLFVSILLLYSTTNLHAQKKNYIAITTGLSYVGMTKSDLENGRSVAKPYVTPGYNLGVNFVFLGKKHLGWGLGLTYSKEGFKKEIIGAFSRFYIKHNPSYLRIPLTLYCVAGSLESKVHPVFFGGISLGILLSDREKIWYKTQVLKENKQLFNYKTFDFGAQLGIGLKIDLSPNSALFCNVKGYQGLTDVLTEDHHLIIDSGNNMNQSIGIQLGILAKL